MINPKAQSSAPFEVLVAVIIMSFVLFMALQAFNFLQEQQCKAQIHEQAMQLKTAIQQTLAGQSNKLSFFPPKCFKNEKKMQLTEISQKAACRAVCGVEMESCLLFVYEAEDFEDRVCFESAATYTNFVDNPNVCSLGITDYIPINFKQPEPDPLAPQIIPRGVYTLQNKTGSGEGIPRICAFLYQRNAGP